MLDLKSDELHSLDEWGFEAHATGRESNSIVTLMLERKEKCCRNRHNDITTNGETVKVQQMRMKNSSKHKTRVDVYYPSVTLLQ